MWIRSQDKRSLLNIDGVFISVYNATDIFSESKPEDISYRLLEKDDAWEMGVYPTEAEALQVLDMIQERIIAIEMDKLFSNRLSGSVEVASFVFQMPPAGFSKASHD